MRGARYMRLISWTLQSGSEQKRWAIGWTSLLVSYWLAAYISGGFFILMRTHLGTQARNAPRSPRLSGQFQKCLRHSVSVTHKASNTLWTFPKEPPIPFKCCPNGLQDPRGHFLDRRRWRWMVVDGGDGYGWW